MLTWAASSGKPGAKCGLYQPLPLKSRFALALPKRFRTKMKVFFHELFLTQSFFLMLYKSINSVPNNPIRSFPVVQSFAYPVATILIEGNK